MGFDQILLVLLGALAGGLVNGLTGFGTGITAMGLWLYAVSPPVASALVLVCSAVSQMQTLPIIWGKVDWRRTLVFVVPGLMGVPIGAWLLPLIDPRTFKIGVGVLLVAYASYVLLRKTTLSSSFGGRLADGTVGFGGGVLGGLSGLSGVLPVVWTDIRGWSKSERRTVLQAFNLTILSAALVSFAVSGLLTREVAMAAAAALPGTVVGAWIGARAYQRLGDRGYQRIIMALLLISGLMLLATSW